MKPQVWCGDKKPQESEMIQIIEGCRYGSKPKGGLWTSPLKNGSSTWIKFCKRHNVYKNEKQKWVLLPEDDADVLHLETKKDLMRVEVKDTDSGLHKTINYEQVFEKYDAVHVYGSMLSRSPFSLWDVESTLWNNWRFRDVIRLSEFNR